MEETNLVLILASIAIGVPIGYLFRVLISRRDAENELAYERGKAAGALAERERIEVHVSPLDQRKQSWLGLKNTVAIGYQSQLYYSGMPVGEPQIVITKFEETWDSKRVDQLLTLSANVAKAYLGALNQAGVQAKFVTLVES